jgi:hypothetical protein
MFSVLLNRARYGGAYPDAIGAVAGQNGQFRGLFSGKRKYFAAISSQKGSDLCNDLTDVVGAMNTVLTSGSQLPSNYLFWKAVDQGILGFHRFRQGDRYVANTAFGIVN